MQYQKRISNQLNDNEAIDQLESTTSAQDTLPKVDVKQKWMTEDILAKIDARGNAKLNTDIYEQLDKEIRRECYASKEIMRI